MWGHFVSSSKAVVVRLTLRGQTCQNISVLYVFVCAFSGLVHWKCWCFSNPSGLCGLINWSNRIICLTPVHTHTHPHISWRDAAGILMRSVPLVLTGLPPADYLTWFFQAVLLLMKNLCVINKLLFVFSTGPCTHMRMTVMTWHWHHLEVGVSLTFISLQVKKTFTPIISSLLWLPQLEYITVIIFIL